MSTTANRSMTRDEYSAALSRIDHLNAWLSMHDRPYTDGCDPDAAAAAYYDRMRVERDRLVRATRPQASEWAAFNAFQARRRHEVLTRVKQRRRDRAAAALDTTGMTPFKAAMARIKIRWAA